MLVHTRKCRSRTGVTGAQRNPRTHAVHRASPLPWSALHGCLRRQSAAGSGAGGGYFGHTCSALVWRPAAAARGCKEALQITLSQLIIQATAQQPCGRGTLPTRTRAAVWRGCCCTAPCRSHTRLRARGDQRRESRARREASGLVGWSRAVTLQHTPAAAVSAYPHATRHTHAHA